MTKRKKRQPWIVAQLLWLYREFLSSRFIVATVTLFKAKDKPLKTQSSSPEGRRRQAHRKKDTKRFRKIIDSIFDDFSQVEDRRAIRAMRHLPPVDPFGSTHFQKRVGEIRSLENYIYFPNWDALPLERAAKNVHGCILGHVHDDDDKKKSIDGSWYILNARRVGLKAMRGRCRVLPPWNVAAEMMGRVRRNVHLWSNIWCSLDGKEWMLLTNDGKFDRHPDDLENNVNRVLMSYQITQRNAWRIIIQRASGGIRLQTPLDAVGVREILMLRDAELGSKRAAIQHLVKEHKRVLANGKTTWVKAHLRGSVQCRWKDWLVDIRPSEHDLQHLEEMETLPETDFMTLLEHDVAGWNKGELTH